MTRFASTETTLPATTTDCTKCGVNKSGKRSCCARGGTWFGKCGDEGDYFAHTWLEGMQACNEQPVAAGQEIDKKTGETSVHLFHSQTTSLTVPGADAVIKGYVNSSEFKKLNILLGFILVFSFF